MSRALTAIEACLRNHLPLLADGLPGHVLAPSEEATAEALAALGLAEVAPDPSGSGLLAWRLT